MISPSWFVGCLICDEAHCAENLGCVPHADDKISTDNWLKNGKWILQVSEVSNTAQNEGLIGDGLNQHKISSQDM